MARIDLAGYKGREQEYVKHVLLEEYLPQLGLKVGSAWDTLVYIDGFAGPWQSQRPDLSDSSFGVATKCLRACRDWLAKKGRHVSVLNLFVEKDNDAFKRLNQYAKTHDVPGFWVKAFPGEFANQVDALASEIQKRAKRPFKFVFLDPKGWNDIPMAALQRLSGNDRSCEVLINLMTKHITRFLGESNRAPSYERLFGRQGVLEELTKHPVGNGERADQAVREYCRSLQQVCGFKNVSQAVILEPGKEEIRYFLVYATNHHRGVEVFKEAEIAAADVQALARREMVIQKTGQEEMFFDGKPSETSFAARLRARYKERSRRKAIHLLLKSQPNRVRFVDIFCATMAYPLVTPDDLLGWLDSFRGYTKLHLAGGARRKIPRCDEDDQIEVTDPTGLESLS